MIIVQLNGGLGNQLFQYALGRVLAIRNNTQLKLDLGVFDKYTKGDTKRKYKLNVFNIEEKKASRKETQRLVGASYKVRSFLKKYSRLYITPQREGYVQEKSYAFQKDVLNLRGDLYLKGYWQSEKYFKDYEDTIRNDFTFKVKFSSKNLKILKKVKESNSVSVHVRRKDYVNNKKTREHHGVIVKDYYIRASETIEEKTKNPNYFVFSDDIAWCEENLGFLKNVTFIDHNKGKKSYEDMRLMSNCKHNIIANSSFSWWGAWLNKNRKKIVIAPKKWFADVSLNTKDRYPNTWIKI